MNSESKSKGPLVIKNWNYAGGALLFAIVLGCISAFMVYIAIQSLKSDKPDDKLGAFPWILIVVFALFSPWLVYKALVAYPLRLELNDHEVNYHTFFGAKTFKWFDIKSWTFEEEKKQSFTEVSFLPSTRKSHRILVLHINGDRELRTKVNADQEAAVTSLLQSRCPNW